MKKFIQKKLKDQKGMTLIELLAVIVILAIIAAIAIPAIGNIIENSRVGAIKSDAQNLLSAGELYFIDNPTEPTVTLEKLKDDKFVDDSGSFKDTTVTITKKTTSKATNITGIGTVGKVQVEFKTATKAEIGAHANSSRVTTGNVLAGPAS